MFVGYYESPCLFQHLLPLSIHPLGHIMVHSWLSQKIYTSFTQNPQSKSVPQALPHQPRRQGRRVIIHPVVVPHRRRLESRRRPPLWHPPCCAHGTTTLVVSTLDDDGLGGCGRRRGRGVAFELDWCWCRCLAGVVVVVVVVVVVGIVGGTIVVQEGCLLVMVGWGIPNWLLEGVSV